MTDVCLVQLLYHSHRTPGTTDEVVVDHVALLSAAKNRLLGITGCLWYGPTRFVQVLEGPPDAVDAVFESIRRDFRHRSVRCCGRSVIGARTFDSWMIVPLVGDEREAVAAVLRRYGLEPDDAQQDTEDQPRTVMQRLADFLGPRQGMSEAPGEARSGA